MKFANPRTVWKKYLFDAFELAKKNKKELTDNEFYRLFKEHHQKFDNNLKVSIHKINSL